MQKATIHTGGLFEVATRLTSIIALPDVNAILQKTILELIDITATSYCSIYLAPDLISTFDEVLIRNNETLHHDSLGKPCIILAASNQTNLHSLLNKAYYLPNEGVTGLSYEKREVINIKNLNDIEAITAACNVSDATNLYKSRDLYSEYNYNVDIAPMLLVPLFKEKRSLGVIKLFGRSTPFTEYDEKVTLLAAPIVSSAIHNAAEFTRHKNSILELIEVGAKKDLEEILVEASKGLRDVLHGEKNQIYIFEDNENISLTLKVENGRRLSIPQRWERGNGLIGWVYKTGKPLIIKDTRFFNEAKHLSEDLLIEISDSPIIDLDDSTLKRNEPYSIASDEYPITFLAVPIKQENEVLGVISSQSRYGDSSRRTTAFDRSDLQLIDSFARFISNTVESRQKKLLSDLLTNIGIANGLNNLYSIIARNISNAVLSAHCSIFEYKRDENGSYLNLVSTNLNDWQAENKPKNLVYRIGEGKTGFCGLSLTTLAINHFGSGDLSESRMDEEINRIIKNKPEDLIERLLDSNGYQVGVIQLFNGKILDTQIKRAFQLMCQKQVAGTNGLPSSKISSDKKEGITSSYSFVAVAIKSETELMGVITIGRSTPQNPFSTNDIMIVEAIAGRIATVLAHLNLQSAQRNLMISLAHEINTPMTGILAESENIKNETKTLLAASEIHNMAKNNLAQAQRLQMMTETIMGVLVNPSSSRSFEFSNLYNVIEEARELFLVEASSKGCDILEPKAIGNEKKFPEIEMSRFEFSIAIKNILHNAVKYSFKSSRFSEKRRFINIWGIWVNNERNFYSVNIQNYGVGISAEEINKRLIFNKFYRGEKANDRRRTGAGFGLAYSRQIIEDVHHGRIEVTSIPSEYGEGYQTTFKITVPVIQPSLKNNWST